MENVTKVLIKLGSDLKEIDVNKDGVIDGKEIQSWISKKTSDGTISEYVFLFVGVIMALIGYLKPGWDWADWGAIFSIGLILGNLIFTGVIKNRIQQKLTAKENELETQMQITNALREALIKATGKGTIKKIDPMT